MTSEHWQDEPEKHDFVAARTYLGLLCDAELADHLVALLQKAPRSVFDAKDLLRSSRLALLERDDIHVAKDFHKVKHGHRLSPVLLVRGRLTKDRPLVVADGYHRICASYWIDEDSSIPCRIADTP